MVLGPNPFRVKKPLEEPPVVPSVAEPSLIEPPGVEEPPLIPPEGITYTFEAPSLPGGHGEPVTVNLLPDFEFVGTTPELRSDDYLIFYQGEKVGRVKTDTGRIDFDDPGFLWKAWVPSLMDRLLLSQSFQVPPEAFPEPLETYQHFTQWLSTPKKVGEVDIPAPADILSMIGLVGVVAITGGAALSQLNLLLQSKLPLIYKHLPGATLKGFPPPPKGVADTKVELKAYKAYQRTAVYRDWQRLVNQSNIKPTSNQYRAVDSRLFEGYRAVVAGDMVTAQRIANQLRYGLSRFPGAVPKGKGLVPYVAPIKPPVTPPVTPSVTPPTGIPVGMTTAVTQQLSNLGYSTQVISQMTPTIAQGIITAGTSGVTGGVTSGVIVGVTTSGTGVTGTSVIGALVPAVIIPCAIVGVI